MESHFMLMLEYIWDLYMDPLKVLMMARSSFYR